MNKKLQPPKISIRENNAYALLLVFIFMFLLGTNEAFSQDPPNAVPDFYGPINEDTSVVIDPILNDNDPNGDPIFLLEINGVPLTGTIQVIPVENGVVDIDAGGVLTYIPNPNFFGTETFTYTVSDTQSPVNLTSIGNVTITIDPVNDLPLAQDDTFQDILVNGGTFNIPVLDNDSFGGDGPSVGPITVTALPAAIGTVTVNDNLTPNDPTDDSLEFLPAANYVGPVSITYTIFDVDGDSSPATVTFNVLPAAELTITKVVNTAGPYNVGDNVEFELTVTNNGPSDATGISVVDKLPDGYTFLTSSDPVFYDDATGEWTIPNLTAIAPGNVTTLTITAQINPTGNYTNIAEITAANEPDPNGVVHGNNTPSEIDQDEVTLTVVPLIDLVTTKVVDNATPNEGGIITYTITVRNNGPSDATNVNIIDVLPVGVTYISNSLGTDYNDLNGNWNIGTIPNGGQATLNITASVDSGTAGTTITNEILATDITSSEPQDIDTTGDILTADIIVTSAELVTTKTVDNATPLEGDTIVYTITVENQGVDDATNVSLTDLLPVGVTYVSDLPSLGTYNNGSGLWTIGDIPSGSTETLDITVTVNQGTTGTTITNTTTPAIGDQSDPNGVADTLSVDIDVLDEVDIVLTKTVDNPTPNPGDTINFTVTVQNNGTSNATNLVVTDILPPGLTFGSATPSEGSWLAPDWTVGNLAPGEQQSIIIQAIVDPNVAVFAPNLLVNTVVNNQDQVDNNTTADDDFEEIIVNASNLVTIKTVDNATPLEGETIVYTISVENQGGPIDATNVELTDLLPVGVTYVDHTESQGFYNNGSGLWSIGDLANGAIATLTITVTVDEGTAGATPITNTTTAATGDQLDPTNAGDILSAVITVVDEVDIVLTKTVDNPNPNAGDTVIYTVTVTNNGTSNATNLEVTDNLPTGLEFGTVTPSEGTWTAPTWFVGNLAPGEQQTLTIEAVINSNISVVFPNPLTNTITNTQDQTDNNVTPDDDVEDIFVQASDLVTEKSVANTNGSTDYNEGDTIIYTITVNNFGPSDATNVSLTDQLPIGVTYVSDNPSQGSYDRVTGVWSTGDIPLNGTATLDITATIDVGTAGTTVTNSTTAASGDQIEPPSVTTVDILDASIDVLEEVDIVLNKTVDNLTPNAGDTVIYTVTVRNNGPVTATNLEVTDNLPTGLTFGAATPSEGTWAIVGTAGIWSIGNLEPGEEQTILIEAIVGFSTVVNPLPITNTVFNTQDQTDNNNTSDNPDADITVTSSDLSISKNVDNPTPNEGDTVIYTISVDNSGPSEATNVFVSDLLPVGLTYVSSTVSQGTYNNGSGEWSIGSIIAGNSAILTIVASVDTGTVGSTIRNTASIVGVDQSDPNPSDNSDFVEITPITEIDLSVSKTILNNAITPEIGSTITFEIVVTNNGPNRATAVEVVDLLPSGYDYVRYSSTKGQYDAATGLWDLGEIEIGDSEILLIDTIVLNGGIYQNCATVIGSNETDIDSTNDQDCITPIPIAVGIDPVILEVDKTIIGGNLSPDVGSEISFEIRLANTDPIETGTGVVVTDILPSGYTFITYSSTKGTYNPTTGEWEVGTIEPGDTEVLIIDVLVNATEDYQNCADITASIQPLAAASIPNSCIIATPIPIIDLEVTKEVALAPGSTAPISNSEVLRPYANEDVIFTITVVNNGLSEATGVELLDVLPDGYEFVSSSSSIGTYDDLSGLWNIGNIMSGGSEELLITATVNAVGDWLNVAEIIAANELDLDSTPNNGDLTEDDIDQVATNPIVELMIPEGFTPNGDGINDLFVIEFLEVLYPNFSIEIVNRNGNRVYQYQHNGDPFTTPTWWDGYSTGNRTVSDDLLPAGTYFYTIYFNNNDRKPQTGWVYLRY